LPTYKRPSREDKETYVEAVFDRVAEKYDLGNRIATLGMFTQLHEQFRPQTGLTPGMKVLDLACGTGDITLLAAEQVAPNGHVIGVDISEKMLEVGRTRVEASPYRHMIEMKRGSAMAIEFPDKTFDSVTMGFALRGVKDVSQVLREALRVLKPGGRFINIDAAIPLDPVSRAMHRLMFRVLTPLLDPLYLRVRPGETVRPYTYLSQSLEEHPRVNELREMFVTAGFQFAGYTTLGGGTTSVHWGHRPVEN
jgi:demethylmenaquinone methyltransferase / 2-methoxy-6-polyprenyl-1,4-benzoquinol methylase